MIRMDEILKLIIIIIIRVINMQWRKMNILYNTMHPVLVTTLKEICY